MEKTLKAGQRVKIDQNQSAYHKARGLRFDYATFVAYTSQTNEVVVKIDGDLTKTIWNRSEVSAA